MKELTKEIAERIKTARENKGLDIKAVSETTGIVSNVNGAADYRVRGVAIDTTNNILYASVINLIDNTLGYHYIKRVNLIDNTITTIGVAGGVIVDGDATTAQFMNITDISFNNITQKLSVLDANNVREIDGDMNVNTISYLPNSYNIDINETGTTFVSIDSKIQELGVSKKRVAVKVNLPPTITTLSPTNNATDITIDNDLEITFNENVTKGTGNITIYNALNDDIVETIAVTSDVVSIIDNVVTINPTTNFLKSNNYYIQVDDTVFKDEFGIAFEGIVDTTTWSFATELRAVPTIAFEDFTKTYGDENFNLTVSSSSTGTVSYEIVTGGTGSATLSGTNYASVTLGNTGTVILKATVAEDANYDAISETATLTITPKSITITADATSKVYGAEDPTLGYTVSPILEGSDVLTGSLTRSVGETVGDYEISSSLANSNYDITYVSADLSITPETITVTADNQTRIYGSENPILTVKYSGFKNGDSVIDLLTVPTVTTLATSTSDVGTYDIEISNGEATNYMFVYVKGILTVTKESQVITFDTLTFGNEDVFDLVATSSSGLAITYTSSDTSVATISGNTVTVLSAGTTDITASQLGNTNYEAAEDVVQELNIASLSTEDKV